MTPDELYVRMLLSANGRGPRHKPLLDLSEPPSADAQAGILAGEISNYQPTWGDYGQAAEGVARGAVTAAPEAIYNAAEDPSLANVTNAGVQTGLALGKFGPAGLFALGGLGIAGAKDAGLFGSEAVASDGASDPLDPTSRKRLNELQAKQAKGQRLSRAEREEQGTYLATVQAASTRQAEAEAKKRELADKAKQDEFDRSVKTAETVRDEALARDYRFQETETGKVWNEISGVAPFAAAGAAGALSRLGTGPGKSLGGKILNDYALPIVAGTGAAFAAQNVPLFGNMAAPANNPQKEAYLAYARELPPEHPRKQEMMQYALGLEDENPVQKEAYDQFNEGLDKRLGVAALEGLTFGKLGASAVNAMGRAYGATGRGGRAAGPTTSPAPAPAQTPPAQPAAPAPAQSPFAGKYGPYSKLPQEVRDDIRGAYADDVSVSGVVPPAKGSAQNLTNMLQSLGIDVNVPVSRVNAINKAVRDFVSQNGRMPTRDEIMGLFNDKTLAVPTAIGAGGLFGLPGDEQ